MRMCTAFTADYPPSFAATAAVGRGSSGADVTSGRASVSVFTLRVVPAATAVIATPATPATSLAGLVRLELEDKVHHFLGGVLFSKHGLGAQRRAPRLWPHAGRGGGQIRLGEHRHVRW
jgi:hypothetical protein